MPGASAGGGVGRGAAQPATMPRIAAPVAMPGHPACRSMTLLLLEALLALGLLVFIVWWVMFAGRRRGERDKSGEPRD
jgi:hypothetical protein